MARKIYKGAFLFLLSISIVVSPKVYFEVIPVLAQSSDPIPDLISQVSLTNLTTVSTDLVTLYGPRREDVFRPFIDNQCTYSSTITYPKTTIEMSADYVVGLFENMGYSSASITLEEVSQGVGHNVYVTKVGSAYPNVYIEFGAHMDSTESSPGGSDNSSGSSVVIELARVLKDYPNRYSMRFILYVAEEFNTQRNSAFFGSDYHVQQLVARGEQIKAALNIDHIGALDPNDPTGYVNGISYNDSESSRIADIFGAVLTQYGIDMDNAKLGAIQNSDQRSYWDSGLTAVSSGGGSFFYNDPYYHNCGDTVSNINFGNVLRVAQQNLAAAVKLDGESFPSAGTPTGTSSVPSPTRTPTLSITSTGTLPTLTATAVSSSGYPSTTILDNFNRSNGAIGSNWAGTTSSYAIVSNRLDVGGGDAAILWQGGSYGADQEVYITLSTVDPSGGEQDLVLKSQSSSTWTSGVLEVLYDAAGNRVQVWTYANGQGWVKQGTDIPVTFANGDQFGARAKANGIVEVYRNGTLIGSRDASGWTYATSGGYIGMWFISAGNAVLDDFGGGTVITTPTATSTNTAAPPTATFTPTSTAVAPTATFTSTSTSVPPTATFTSTNTAVPPAATFTPTNTAVPPTATFTSTNTAVPPTATFTPTNTAVPPTATFTSTNTAVPPAATFTPTNTAVPPTATFTSTNTAVPPTATFTSTNTAIPPTATYTLTATAVSSSGYPSTTILDNFNRSNGAIGSNWAGTTSSYAIVSNRLDAGNGNARIFWQGASFGVDQEVFVTLINIDAGGTEQDLLLKSQSNSSWTGGVLEVLYDAAGHRVQVWTYAGGQGWVQWGADIPVTFANGDQFGARAKANGIVEVYRNGFLIGTRDASGWSYSANGGYIGLWFISAGNAVLDDFGGGTVVAGP